LGSLQERTPQEGRIWPKHVVLPAPTITQDLRFRSRGEQLGIEELISEKGVEEFRETGLPRGARCDEGRPGGIAGLTQVP